MQRDEVDRAVACWWPSPLPAAAAESRTGRGDEPDDAAGHALADEGRPAGGGGWCSPEELAAMPEDARPEYDLAIVPPGKTGFTGKLSGEFPRARRDPSRLRGARRSCFTSSKTPSRATSESRGSRAQAGDEQARRSSSTRGGWSWSRASRIRNGQLADERRQLQQHTAAKPIIGRCADRHAQRHAHRTTPTRAASASASCSKPTGTPSSGVRSSPTTRDALAACSTSCSPTPRRRHPHQRRHRHQPARQHDRRRRIEADASRCPASASCFACCRGSRSAAARCSAARSAASRAASCSSRMPGSTKAVELAMTKLILPELRHLLNELRK